MRALSLACLAVPVLIAACADTPAEPVTDQLLAVPTYDAGRDGGTVTVPMKIESRVVWTVPGATPADCPDLIDPSTGELFTAVGTTYGEATHLGHFTAATFDHPTINLCDSPTLDDVTRTGRFELVAADGSTLFGSYDFLFTGVPGTDYFYYTVTGGTGRMEGATGTLTFLAEESGAAQLSDPLALGPVVIDPAIVEGELILPRPGRGR